MAPAMVAGWPTCTQILQQCVLQGVGHWTDPQGVINIHIQASAMRPAGVGHWNGHQGIVNMRWHNCPEEGVFKHHQT